MTWVAITGSERIGLTVVITEGFGEIAMSERTFRILQQREGRQASVNATQIRAGVMRPEIVIPVKQTTPPTTPTANGKLANWPSVALCG